MWYIFIYWYFELVDGFLSFIFFVIDSLSNLDISATSSNLNMELENKQAVFFPQEEDDDGEQTDKSSESELGMKE